MAWGGRHHDDDEPQALQEWQAWVVCLLGAVMPTSVLATIVDWIEGQTAPAFVPALYIGVFTIAVLLMRPWRFG
ncbi:hypothetical protein [Caulobacter endophyticus]|uniref:Uncharacterized protein n=1 Tax=Caulobacter endophyticus TaxID=2172652 RepID=A0A2T9JI76_9CAUL|nr:hypothetical protein [Caulobacter endophyticus]PVM83401.1 hypothetical protein DDF67_20910 [Caulobacter endophyticus]